MFARHVLLLSAVSRSSAFILNSLHHCLIPSMCLVSKTGVMVFSSRRLTHFSRRSAFLYIFLLAPLWYRMSITRDLFMFGPVKYMAESKLPVPIVVALDIAIYAVPGLLPSNDLVPGSTMIVSTAFGDTAEPAGESFARRD